MVLRLLTQNYRWSTQPCPCGFYNHPDKDCTCHPGVVQKYLNRISGPLLDRIDLHVEVTPVPFRELSDMRDSRASAEIRESVIAAREVQKRRFIEVKGIFCNAMMQPRMLRQYCRLDEAGSEILKTAMTRMGLSARAYDRILKVSRTIADLDHSASIRTEHIAEAIQYRSLDRDHWLQ